MTALLARLTRLFTLPNRLRDAPSPRPATALQPRRSARATFAWFAVALITLHVGVLLATDVLWPRLRDPEYGRRSDRLRARVAENPGRALVLALGSSRAAAGVNPAAWEAARPGRLDDPLLFNMGQVGGGPLIQLLTLHRVYADGHRPDVVLLEYWPPFLSYDEWPEWPRVEATRLYRTDLPVVREYFRDPDKVERAVDRGWVNPVYALRHRFLIQVFPRWFPWPKRFDVAWDGLDDWGWLPGLNLPAKPTQERAKRLADCAGFYKGNFPKYTVHPEADRNLRAAVELARRNGAKVAFYFLPESAEFRGWYTPAVEERTLGHLRRLSAELAVPVIDARAWADDYHLVDGFHLSRIGAGEFTRKLAPALREALPGLGGKP